MTPDWDKLFPKSDKIDHEKVTFHNHYGIELAADLFKPKGAPDFGRLREDEGRGVAHHD